MAEPAQHRRATVLRVVVDEYVRSAEPIGSNHVLSNSAIDASSATIRNDMATLESEGYLVQPHVSAGRVPTDKGYRFYVDRFSRDSHLDDASTTMLNDFFDHTTNKIEALLHETSRLLSSLTNCTSVLTMPPSKATGIRHIQLISLTEHMGMVVVVTNNGAIHKELFEYDFSDFDSIDTRLNRASAVLTQLLQGRELPTRQEVVPHHEPDISQLIQSGFDAVLAIHETPDAELLVNEASKVANSFVAVEKVGMILEALEQQIMVVSLMKDIVDRGQNVSIGNENGLESLLDCALVIAPYELDGRMAGAIGVIGPTRMNYPLALAAVQRVSDGLGRILGEG